MHQRDRPGRLVELLELVPEQLADQMNHQKLPMHRRRLFPGPRVQQLVPLELARPMGPLELLVVVVERRQLVDLNPGLVEYRWVGIKLLRFFENISFSRTNSNGTYRAEK